MKARLFTALFTLFLTVNFGQTRTLNKIGLQTIEKLVTKVNENDKVLRFLSKTVCKFSGRRLNFYFQNGIDSQEKILGNIFQECFLPVESFG